jgi:hypothetical protein
MQRYVGVVLAGFFLAATMAAAPLTIEVADHQVWVRGVTPGASVALFGAGYGQGIVSPFLFDWAGLGQDGNQDGAVQIIPPTGHGYDTTVSHSVWVAVDLTSGAWGKTVLSLASGWTAWTEVPLTQSDLVREPLGVIAVCPSWAGTTRESRWASALVRVGRGMWTGASIVGDAPAALVFTDMTAVSDAGAPPERLAPGDVLVAINPQSYGYYADTISLELLTAGRLRVQLR